MRPSFKNTSRHDRQNISVVHWQVSDQTVQDLDRAVHVTQAFNCVVVHPPDSIWLQPSVLHHCPGSALQQSDWPALLR